jgi:hypothetical protein
MQCPIYGPKSIDFYLSSILCSFALNSPQVLLFLGFCRYLRFGFGPTLIESVRDYNFWYCVGLRISIIRYYDLGNCFCWLFKSAWSVNGWNWIMSTDRLQLSSYPFNFRIFLFFKQISTKLRWRYKKHWKLNVIEILVLL